MTVVLLVRHAHAGSKDRWRGDDRARPLSALGRAQADALGDLLAPLAPIRVVSSPLLRCVETMAPLLDALGLRLELDDRLEPDAEGGGVAVVRDVAEAPGPVVVCTHGEVIEAVQRGMPRRRSARFGPSARREKGSAWILHVGGGRVLSADYLPPGLTAGTTRARAESSGRRAG